MESANKELYFVFMNYDPEYQRLRNNRSVSMLHYYRVCECSLSNVLFSLFLFFPFLRKYRTKRGANELDLYLSRKHEELLASMLEPGSYKKTLSFVIVDGFAVEITEDQVLFFFFLKKIIYIMEVIILIIFMLLFIYLCCYFHVDGYWAGYFA